MAIKVYCSCGKVTNVPDSYAGKMGKCPGCKQPVRVPMLETVPAEIAETARPEISPASQPQVYQEPAAQYTPEQDPYETAERGSEARFRAAPVAEPVAEHPSQVDDAISAGADSRDATASDEYATAAHDHAPRSAVDDTAEVEHEHSHEAHVTNESVIETTSEIYESADAGIETPLAEPHGLNDSPGEETEIQSASHEYDLDDGVAAEAVAAVDDAPEYDISKSHPPVRPIEDIGSGIGDDAPTTARISDNPRIPTTRQKPAGSKKSKLGIIVAVCGLLIVAVVAVLIFISKKNGGSLPLHR